MRKIGALINLPGLIGLDTGTGHIAYDHINHTTIVTTSNTGSSVFYINQDYSNASRLVDL